MPEVSEGEGDGAGRLYMCTLKNTRVVIRLRVERDLGLHLPG